MMKTLDSFASSSPHGGEIFRDAPHLPLFFQNNLLDPSRVVKHFGNDPQANIRVFYYQYLKLCFELENVDFEGYIRKIEELINNDEFKFIFYEEDDPELFNDLQFKQLIMEFFGVLGQGGVAIQQAINYYPIMDTVFIYFFRALLILTGRTDALDSYIDREELFQFLCGYFNVEISIHDRCIKFVESDIFVYEEDPKDVYMAYMEEVEEEEGGLKQQQSQQQEHFGEQEQSYLQTNAYSQQQEYSEQEEEPYTHHNEPYHQQQRYSHQEQEQQEYQTNYHQVYPQEVIQQEEPVSVIRSLPQKEDPTPIHDISYGSSGSQRGTSEINKSYISSQFVDYTHTANLHSMVKKDLKESAQIPKQPTFGKILLEPNQKEYKSTSQSYKPQTPEQPYESPLDINSYFPPDPISNSKYGSTFMHYASGETASVQSNPSKYTEYETAKPGSHHQETPFSKKPEDVKAITKMWEAPPTKDPGFSKYSPLESVYQPHPATKKYGEGFQSKLQVSKPASYASYEDKYEVKKPSSSFEPIKPQSSSYNPSSYITTTNPKAPPPSIIPSYKPPSPIQPPFPIQYPLPGQTTKSPFNLNVSLQFTNSFTMKVMAEPFRTNVRSIRNRARDYRNSLISFIK